MGTGSDALVEIAGELLGVVGAGQHCAEVLDDAYIRGCVVDGLKQDGTLQELQQLAAVGLRPTRAVGAIPTVALYPGQGVLEGHGVDDGSEHVVGDDVGGVDVVGHDEVRHPPAIYAYLRLSDARCYRSEFCLHPAPRVCGVVVIGVRRDEAHRLPIRQGRSVFLKRVEARRNNGFNIRLTAGGRADSKEGDEQAKLHFVPVFARIAVNGVYL